MIVTAEPYFAVSIPSEMVVLENFAREDTKGRADYVDAKFELLKRGRYEDAPSRDSSRPESPTGTPITATTRIAGQWVGRTC
jgi:hypothetical protein